MANSTDKIAQNFMDNGAFIYSEARLAKYLGIPRKELTESRAKLLRKDFDWKNKGGEIALTIRGFLLLLESLGLSSAEVQDDCCLIGKKEAGAPPMLLCDRGQTPSPIQMRVFRIFPNPRLIEAQECGRAQFYRVLVQSNLNLTIGMEFPAIPDPSNPGFWRISGPLPRWRGRW